MGMHVHHHVHVQAVYKKLVEHKLLTDGEQQSKLSYTITRTNLDKLQTK